MRAVPADARPCILRRRNRVCAARHEFVALPTTGSPSPSLGRGRGSADREVDGRPVGVSNVGSIGGGASRDAIARRCPAARAPRRCASSASFGPRRSKKESVARLEVRALGPAFHRRQLLPQRQVLQYQFAMAAERQRQRAADHHEQLQHASIVADVASKIKEEEFWRGSKCRNVHRVRSCHHCAVQRPSCVL